MHPLVHVIIAAITAALDYIWIRESERRGIVAADLHKPYEKLCPRIGALPNSIILPLALALVGMKETALISLFLSFIGLVDDVIGLRNMEKVVFAGIPFLIIQGHPVLFIPALLFPLISFLFGSFSSNATNTLAGYNGLETGLISIIACFMTIISSIQGNLTALDAYLMVLSCYLPFLIFNFYPARAFPGNVATFQMGGVVAAIALANKQEIALGIMMIPYFADFLLKMMSYKATFMKIPARVDENGYISPPGNLSLAGVLLRIRRMKELQLVASIWAIELIFCLISLGLML
ncbi:MAG: hypothetical protein ACP5LQ_00105 [Candidatus Methanodesulfokora sp.]